jgi:hypothetical protein
MVRKHGDTLIGIYRRGLVVAIPDPIREAVEQIRASSSKKSMPPTARAVPIAAALS